MTDTLTLPIGEHCYLLSLDVRNGEERLADAYVFRTHELERMFDEGFSRIMDERFHSAIARELDRRHSSGDA